MSDPDFGGLPVIAFESRRAAEMASLVQRYRGVPVTAPALREVRSSASAETLAFAEQLGSGNLNLVLLLTGVGTRALAEGIAPVLPRERFVQALSATQVVARGPKPAAVLRELASPASSPSPPPTRSTRSSRASTRRSESAASRASAVWPSRSTASRTIGSTRASARVVYTSPPCRCTPGPSPEDTAPLRRALAMLGRGDARIALFTTRAQVDALLVAAEEGIEAEVRAALARGVVASIGPVCSDALRAEQLPPGHRARAPEDGSPSERIGRAQPGRARGEGRSARRSRRWMRRPPGAPGRVSPPQ